MEEEEEEEEEVEVEEGILGNIRPAWQISRKALIPLTGRTAVWARRGEENPEFSVSERKKEKDRDYTKQTREKRGEIPREMKV